MCSVLCEVLNSALGSLALPSPSKQRNITHFQETERWGQEEYTGGGRRNIQMRAEGMYRWGQEEYKGGGRRIL